MESPLRKATKGYKQQETLLGKHDLSPAIKNPSPLQIKEALQNGNYKQEKVEDIKSKLREAVNHAHTAAALSGDHDTNHQLRINTYNDLIQNWPA